MKRPAAARTRLRLWVWTLGVLLSLGDYFAHAIWLPRHTDVGVERRLFGLGDTEPRIMESTSGGRWVLVRKEGDDMSTLTPTATLWDRLQPLRWPALAAPYRQFAPFQAAGTWLLDGGSPRRVWSLPASGWLDDRHLWLGHGWDADPTVLDLRRRRMTRGAWEEVKERYIDAEQAPPRDYEEWDWDRDFTRTLISPLEQLSKDFSGGWQVEHHMGAQRLFLVHTWDASQEPVAAYAILDEPAPRVLRVAHRAEPLALSHDGRTLFFRRDGSLWRLDLRRPVAELLAETPAPELPDPLTTDREENQK